MEIDGKPMLLIYAKVHGTHTHIDIEGTGQLIRYEDERMPEPGDVHTWLIMKTQEALRTTIVARPWDATSINIMAVAEPLTRSRDRVGAAVV